MPRGFGRLPFLKRRSTSSGRGSTDQPTMPPRSVDPDAAPVGPPVLLPASIIRQVLFDASELTPVWARSRPEPASIAVPAVTAEPTVRKRTRRAPTGGPAKAARAEATPRRTRRKDRSPDGDGST
jgi:hypothetical protein